MAGFQKTIVITESEQTTNYSKRNISLGLASFIKTIETFGRPKSVNEKYWNFVLSLNSNDKKNNRLSSGAPHR